MSGSAAKYYSALGTEEDAAAGGLGAPLLLEEEEEEAQVPVAILATKNEAEATCHPRVEVIAPASLPGGYELHCDFRGRPVKVRVVSVKALRPGGRIVPVGSCQGAHTVDDRALSPVPSPHIHLFSPRIFSFAVLYNSPRKERRRERSSWRP